MILIVKFYGTQGKKQKENGVIFNHKKCNESLIVILMDGLYELKKFATLLNQIAVKDLIIF
jgi:hypothetical protein